MNDKGWDDDLENQSDRILDDLCAREVLDWKVAETDAQGAAAVYEARFRRGWEIRVRRIRAQIWRPTASWRDLGRLIAAIRKMGWILEMEAGPRQATAQVMMPLRPGASVGLGDASQGRDLHHAVVLACIRHVREVREGWARHPVVSN